MSALKMLLGQRRDDLTAEKAKGTKANQRRVELLTMEIAELERQITSPKKKKFI